MSTQTTNYNLIKPSLQDAADITATNQNWDTIDAKLHEVNGTTQQLTEDLQSVNDKTARLTPNKIVLIDGVDYGEELPTTGVKGQLFFKKV